MKVLVCGSRDYTDYVKVFRELTALHEASHISVIIEGEAKGADTIAKEWAIRHNVRVAKFPADWHKYGPKAAGPIRNQQMLDEGKPDMVIAFPSGNLETTKGTKDMVRRAKKAGVPVTIIE